LDRRVSIPFSIGDGLMLRRIATVVSLSQ